MRQFETTEISKSVLLFCRLVKFGKPCTAKAMCCSNRTARLIKLVLTHKFIASAGAPYDFPKLFICDDVHKQLYHKSTTPNDVELSDLKTIEIIKSLMTYIGREERQKDTETTHIGKDDFSFSLKGAKDIIITKKGNELVLKFIF